MGGGGGLGTVPHPYEEQEEEGRSPRTKGEGILDGQTVVLYGVSYIHPQ